MEVAVAYLKVLSRNLPGETEKSHGNSEAVRIAVNPADTRTHNLHGTTTTPTCSVIPC